MKLFSNRLRILPLFFAALVTSPLWAQTEAGYVTTPPNWPSGKIAAGYPWGSAVDGLAVDAARGVTTYPLRYISTQTNQSGMIDAGIAIAALNELSAMLPNLRGWNEPYNDVKIGTVMSMFSTELGEQGVEPTEEKYKILRKMNDVNQIARWFNYLPQMQTAMASAGQTAVVLEPNVWGTILQARFHFEDEICNETWCGGRPWSQVLDFYIPLNEGLAAANSPIAAEVSGNPTLFPQSVRGLARAMVLAAKRAFPSATIFAHTSTWAVYANGCAGSGATDNLTSKNLLDFKSIKSMVNWAPEDIELSAMANVRFYRELFGWDWNDEEHVNDYNGGLMWPHGFAVEKYGYDAGMVEASNHYTIQTTDPNGMPGAGTRAFYWNQNQMDNWLRWCSVLSQGSKLPLLAYGIPLGNGSLANQPLSWKDTFVDWLFNSTHWGDTYTWNPDNWERFKQAGFIGIWAGRGGWPATGTHWASRAVSAGDGSGCFATINGQYIDCPANTPGDNGYFFSQLRSRDLTFTPIPITFDEENFAKFSGFCTGRSEATVKTEFFGIQAKDAAGNRKDGVFSSGSKTPTATVDGATTTQALDNNTAIAQMPDYMKSNALWLFALENGKYEAIQGDLASGTRVNGGLVNDASKAQIKQVLENQVSTIGLMLEVDFSTIEGWPYWEDRPDWRIASVFPMEYELYVYDHLGHYINSVNGFLSDVDVAKYSRVDPEDGHLKLSLLLYFVPMDSEGRHIGTGVYTMRGFFKEQTKWLCQPLKPDPSSETGCAADGQQNPIPGNCPMTVGGAIDVVKDICPAYILERYRVNVSDPGSIAAGNWETNVFQNSVVVTEKFGYTRIRQKD